MPDTETPNFALTKPSARKGWGEAMNGNLERLGKLFCVDNAGNLWFVSNALYDSDTDTWAQEDTELPSMAMQIGSSGAYFFSCPAGNATITWAALNVECAALVCGALTASGNISTTGDLDVTGDISADDIRAAGEIIAEIFKGFTATVSDSVREGFDETISISYPDLGYVYSVGSVVIPDVYAHGTPVRVAVDCAVSSGGYGGAQVYIMKNGEIWQTAKAATGGSGSSSQSIVNVEGTVDPGDILTAAVHVNENSSASQGAAFYGMDVCCDDELNTDVGFSWAPWQS